jgi:hypothetical protein
MSGAATPPSFDVPILHHDPEELQKFSDAIVLENQSAGAFPDTPTLSANCADRPERTPPRPVRRAIPFDTKT